MPERDPAAREAERPGEIPPRGWSAIPWVGSGAVVALAPWLLGSVGFSYHVDIFGRYNQTYGAWPR